MSAGPGSAAASPYPIKAGLFGKRYCEFLLVELQSSSPLLHIEVWSTQGLNTCPAAAWAASTTPASLETTATQMGVDLVMANGPRWWAIDRAGATIHPETGTLGSLAMRHFADIDIDAPPGPWSPTTVQRTSTFIYDKGTYVHRLTSPSGHRYVMQSWTTAVSPKVTRRSLNTLASGKSPLLELPRGWKYHSIKLTKPLRIKTTGTISVLQDNLKNSYSKIS